MKRSEIIPAVLALVGQALPGKTVVYDDFSPAASAAMETALQAGVCLVVKPLLGSKRIQQAGARVAEHVDFSVHVRVNPAEVPNDFNTYEAQDRIIEKLCGDRALTANAGASDGSDVSTLVLEDIGCLTHALLFHVKVTNL